MFSSFIKTSLLSLSLVGVAPMVSSAQRSSPEMHEGESHARHGRRGRRGHRHGPRFMRQLDLSENQQAQMRAIRESLRERRQEIRSMEGPARRAAMRALRAERRELVEDVLTPAQKSQLETLRANHRNERRERRLARMTEHLSLSDAQQTRIRAIFEDAARARAEARRNEDPRPAMRAVRQSTRAAIERVLTEEQRSEWASRPRRGRRGGR